MEQSDLPHDLITQNILTRLPVETLIRFKTVSKQWKSTLCSLEFAHAHLSFPRSSSSEVSLLIRSNDKFTILSYEDGSECGMKLQKMEVDFGVWCDQLSLVGTCNGLVCLGSISGSFFIIWNPITQEFREYPGIEINYYDNFFSLWIQLLKGPGETEQILLPVDSITNSTCQNMIGFPRSDKIFTLYGKEIEPLLGMIDPSLRPVKHTPLMMTFERTSRIEIASYSASLISLCKSNITRFCRWDA